MLQACNGQNHRITQERLIIDSLNRELSFAKAELERSSRKQPLNSFVISQIDKHFEQVFVQYYGKSEGLARLKVMNNIIGSDQVKKELYHVWK
ncbi:hypothetical protein SAMN04488055_5423 [Chitinophaga niabensis]|uniref:Uncharacterized protein n=2 Tax=Chitinophaga niabensis TaxID=536979 RepID=A0A1N6KA99_9BACT|nr:hypothetical protein SAMN04488055_5423 [Chitinophaga niabensis]